jgi:hypothetical protein
MVVTRENRIVNLSTFDEFPQFQHRVTGQTCVFGCSLLSIGADSLFLLEWTLPLNGENWALVLSETNEQLLHYSIHMTELH